MKTILAVLLVAAPVFAAPKRVTCETTDGSLAGRKVTIDFEQPIDTKFNAKACGFEFPTPLSIVMVNVIHQDDAGPELLLNEKEDGALKWVNKISGGKLKLVASERHTLHEEAETLYRLSGDFHGLKDAEVLVARVKFGKHNILYMAQYPAKDAEKFHASVLQTFTSTIVKIAQ